MEATETKFKRADVLPIVKYYMDELGIYDLFSEFVPQGRCLIPTQCKSQQFEAIPRQVNYLIDEADFPGKGADTVISLIFCTSGEYFLVEDIMVDLP